MALPFLALLPAGASGQQKRPPPPRGAFELFSGPATLLDANEVECGLTDTGLICVNSFSSPTGGGGFWPRGTIDQYFFDSGLQVAGRTSAAAGPWAGDTVAAYFFDLALGQVHGAPLAGTLDSRSAADVAAWPAEARVSDADRFEPSLLGRVAASEQDSWTQYWDGDPANNTGRKHPMGIRVTQRTLAWNYPLGNESIVYVLFELENVTNDAEFQRLNELEFFAGADALPNAGWPIDSIWLGYAADYDVSSGGAGQNFSTVIHPFDMGISYHGAFSAPQFAYPGRFFKHPFFRTAPGIVGARFLSTPVDPSSGMPLGLTMFSFTGGPSSVGCCLVEPRGEDQLWRYLSGRFDPTQGDGPCGLPPETPDRRSLCQIRQQSHDTRFYESTGPFSLGPGEKQEIAIAIVVAAAVQLMPDGSPTGIIANASSANANAPGTPSMHPGFASARGCDVNGQNCTDVLSAAQNPVKAIERAAGWVAYAGPPPAGALEGPADKLDASRVQVVPESLLGKALIAQTLFDNKFLLPAPPAAPPFHLVPGDGRVTLVWDPSPSETAGDPFFAVASDPTSALFNPNYRGNPNPAQPHGDVEGYRIWRGTDPSDLRVIAQFDYADTQFLDFTCETVTPTEDVGASAVLSTGDTASVRGFAPGELCPFGAAPRARPIAGVRPFLIFNNGGAGGAPGGAVRRLEDLRADAARLDTVARIASAPGFFLGDSDVPFVFVDTMVQNNFTYFYAVSTFDVNSPASGPTSLESAKVTKSTVPRANSPNLVLASFTSSFSGDDGVPLNPSGPSPSLDAGTGIFSGGFPPTDGLTTAFAPLVERLLPQFSLTIRIDSVQVRASGNLSGGTQEFPPSSTCTVIPGTSGRLGSPFGECWVMYLTADRDGNQTTLTAPGYNPWWSAFGEPGTVSLPTIAAVPVDFDAEALRQFGIPSGSANSVLSGTTSEGLNNSASEGAQNRRFGTFHGGARWFDGDPRDGDNNTIADPTMYRRVGHVTGADTVWAPISHTPQGPGTGIPGNSTEFEKQCFNRALGFLDRAADIVYEWSGGTVSVRDVTHNVDVPFSAKAGPTWGFLTTDANGNGVLDWHDFNYIDRALQILRQVDGGSCNLANGTSFDPSGVAVPVDLVSTPTLVPTSTNGLGTVVDLEAGAPLAQTGMGFGLFAYGHRFIFEMSALPADGTKWTLRTYKGNITSSDDGVGAAADPSGYAFATDVAGGSGPRPILIPGLEFNFQVAQATGPVGAPDLSKIHTVPDPYLGTSVFDLAPTEKRLQFVNLPEEATIRIYTLTGVLVDIIRHRDQTGGGRTVWDLRNRNNQFVASGVYFFHVLTPSGEEHVGKFTVVNFAGQN